LAYRGLESGSVEEDRSLRKEKEVATTERRYGPGAGITLGGIIVIAGILVWILFGWTIVGIILILVGLLAFGGFSRGRWY
jgi:hypothetical protein